MSDVPQFYILDANVFIQAKRRFYPFDVCPGYWDALRFYGQEGRVCSIDWVSGELKKGADELWDWVMSQFGEQLFHESSGAALPFASMVDWVQRHPRFNEGAKSQFMGVADGWLAAYAKIHGGVLVTLEEYDPMAVRKVPLVNLCREFQVETITTFEMLRRLKVKLGWNRQG